MTTRAARRAQARDLPPGQTLTGRNPRPAQRAADAKPSKLRVALFLGITAIVIGGGVYLAGSVFLGQRGQSNVAGAIAVRISMDGFDPNTLNATPGQTITLDWWNQDAPMHLTNGVHTLVSDKFPVNLSLPAQSRKTVTITAPTTPGDYDFWCDSCCGGKDNPKMHGTLHVAA
ncbi:MAG TPA: cupredoxin domain-containing protein [Candidatus Limnocylindrales bacterium]